MTSLFNTAQEKTTATRMNHHDAFTPFPSNLRYHKLTRNCVTLRTTMPSSNPLSDVWKMGLYIRTHRRLRKLYDKKVSISSVTVTFYTIICREKNRYSTGSIEDPTNGALTLAAWPFHNRSPWFKQNVWTPEIHILLEHVCRLTTLDQILCFPCPQEKRYSPLQTTFSAYHHLWVMGSYCRRLYGPSSSYEFGKSIFLLWATSLQSISKLQPCLQSKLLSSPRCFWIKLSLDMVPLIAFWLIVEQTLRRNLWQLCNDLNIHKIFTSSYHPQCDSFVELINGVIMQIIVMYVAADHKDWDTYLPSATCKHNNAWNPIMINMPRIIPSG